jgi:O-antigen/teichoic acid export membrane protein
MVLISGMMILNSRADIVMVGIIKGPEYAGIYTVANRGAELITFFLNVVEVVLAPTIARLYSSGEMGRLQQIVTKSARLVLGLSLPLTLVLFIWGKWFLMMFGHDFTEGTTVLAILSIARLINAAAGSIGLLLIMTGYQRDSLMGIGISTTMNLVLNALFIPKFGIEGAATATAISMIAWNIILSIQVYRRLGIYATALGKLSFK